jgi:hypothetical protein
MTKAEELELKSFEKVRLQIMDLIDKEVERGETKVTLSYKFFKGNNKLLKYILETIPQDGFVIRLYEEKMEIRWSE